MSFVLLVAALTGLDVLLKTVLAPLLAAGPGVDLIVIQLQLAYNPGVAFSMGGSLPSWVILLVTGAVTLGVAGYAWRYVRTGSRLLVGALTLVSAGAFANLFDRAGDGVVTDYLHTGWFPTFNLADVYITVGSAGIVLAMLRQPAHTPDAEST